jgi:hypothetical protein
MIYIIQAIAGARIDGIEIGNFSLMFKDRNLSFSLA